MIDRKDTREAAALRLFECKKQCSEFGQQFAYTHLMLITDWLPNNCHLDFDTLGDVANLEGSSPRNDSLRLCLTDFPSILKLIYLSMCVL